MLSFNFKTIDEGFIPDISSDRVADIVGFGIEILLPSGGWRLVIVGG